MDLEDQANRRRSEISRLFADIRGKLIDREATIKRRISETLEREQGKIKKRIGELDD
jgi:hypothetical protein